MRKSTRREIAAWFGAEDDEVLHWDVSYNVAPQTAQPVIRRNPETGTREIVLMRWGLVPYWSKDAKIAYSTLNAKAETVATAPAFRDAFQRRRCLVPADAFYEWQKLDPKHKQPFAIALASRDPYGFAGLWDRWKDSARGQMLDTFTIITTNANPLVEPLHTRMPVILERKDYARWLDHQDATDLLALLRPFPAEQMIAWKVDKSVGNSRNDRPELLEPEQAIDQPFLPLF